MDSTARVRQVPLALAMLLTVPCVVVGAVLFAGQDQADAVDQIFKQAYFGRGKRGDQAYPAHQLPAGQATQNIRTTRARSRSWSVPFPRTRRASPSGTTPSRPTTSWCPATIRTPGRR
jgi:hypothetical protein